MCPKSTEVQEMAFQSKASAFLPASICGVSSDALDVEDRFKNLTATQMRVAGLLSQGHSNKMIAYSLKKSQATIKAHISVVLKLLNCTNRTQAALIIFRWHNLENRI